MNSVNSSAENPSQPSVLISGDVNVGVSPAQRVTADGTYATQSAFTLRRLRKSIYLVLQYNVFRCVFPSFRRH